MTESRNIKICFDRNYFNDDCLECHYLRECELIEKKEREKTAVTKAESNYSLGANGLLEPSSSTELMDGPLSLSPEGDY